MRKNSQSKQILKSSFSQDFSNEKQERFKRSRQGAPGRLRPGNMRLRPLSGLCVPAPHWVRSLL